MTDFMQIFSGNPMTTLVGKKIEQATDPLLIEEDWVLNLEICDIINETDDGARDAIRAIKKRLIVDSSKNFNVIYRTLTILETCVNNCNLRFHILCMNKDYIQELVKLIGPKNDPPIELQERVLSLIERWADAFDTQPELQGVVKVYQELKSKGITFPPQNFDTVAPIQTPRSSAAYSSSSTNRDHQPTVTILNSNNRHGGAGNPDSPTQIFSGDNYDNMNQPRRIASPQLHHQQQPDTPVMLDNEGYNKISQNLSVVQSSVNVFNDILSQLTVKNDIEEWNLLEELNTSCRQMKVRIVDLIEWVANENLTIELLRLNDELNNAFVKYERLLKKQQSSSKATAYNQEQQTTNILPEPSPVKAASTTNNTFIPSPNQPSELSLIDFKDEDASSSDKNGRSCNTNTRQLVKNSVGPTTNPIAKPSTDGNEQTSSISNTTTKTCEEPDFDNFAQSRSSINSDRKGPTNHEPVEEVTTNLNKVSLNKDVIPAIAATQSSTAKLPEEISSVCEQDFEEIEKWLANESNNQLVSSDAISMPNSEFENFLAIRASAGDKQQTK